MMRRTLKILSVVLSAVMLLTVTPFATFAEETPDEDVYIVAGQPATIFQTEWDATNENNRMTRQADGTYTKQYTARGTNYNVQIKVVKNGTEWIGDENGNEIAFNLTRSTKFTVTYDPATNAISVSGKNVELITGFSYQSVSVVGNGTGAWLNGADWDPACNTNKMYQADQDIWKIRFDNVPEGTGRQLKFAIDGTMRRSFGGAFEDFGAETTAVYQGDSITFDTGDKSTVIVTLDLSGFDYVTKQGATFTVNIYNGDDIPDLDCYVAGSSNEIFGSNWGYPELESNRMIKQADGTYANTYTVDKAYTFVELYTVKDHQYYIGGANGNAVTFNITGAGSFTVVYDPAANVTSVRGDVVETFAKLNYQTVYVAGNGNEGWLNDVSWVTDDASNELTQTDEDVWTITYDNMTRGTYTFSYLIDGSWDLSFGGTFEGSGIPTPAVKGGSNITFQTDNYCSVTLKLDLSNYNILTEEGALFTVTIHNAIIGDANGDGIINISDVTAIQRHLANIDVFTEKEKYCADIDRVNEITINDATRVQRYLAEFDAALC